MSDGLRVLGAALLLNLVFATGALGGERMLGLSISELPGLPYDQSLAEAREAGIGYVALPLAWDDLETEPGQYDPDPDWLAIAAAYYPSAGLPFALEINPIDTVADRRPDWLRDRAWDDPGVINAYAGLLAHVLAEAAGATLISITIGNEVDVLLAGDTKAWAAYKRFLDAAKREIHVLRPGLPVAVKTTFEGLAGPHSQAVKAIHAGTDLVQLTFYGLAGFGQGPDPKTGVRAAFDKMSAAFPGRTIHLAEIGYPSGTRCYDGEAGQAAFVKAFFESWDAHAGQIEAALWEWMYDIPAAGVDAYARYYGISDPCFTEFLATLGLKHPDGSAKPGWDRFTREARQRFKQE